MAEAYSLWTTRPSTLRIVFTEHVANLIGINFTVRSIVSIDAHLVIQVEYLVVAFVKFICHWNWLVQSCNQHRRRLKVDTWSQEHHVCDQLSPEQGPVILAQSVQHRSRSLRIANVNDLLAFGLLPHVVQISLCIIQTKLSIRVIEELLCI